MFLKEEEMPSEDRCTGSMPETTEAANRVMPAGTARIAGHPQVLEEARKDQTESLRGNETLLMPGFRTSVSGPVTAYMLSLSHPMLVLRDGSPRRQIPCQGGTSLQSACALP